MRFWKHFVFKALLNILMIDFLTLLVLQLVNLLEGVLPRNSDHSRKTDSFIFDFGLKHLFTYPSCLFC